MVKENGLRQQQLFDRFAVGYSVVDVFSFGFADHFRREALNKISFSKGGTVLDLMCGTGNNAEHVVKNRIGKLNYVGIDFSQNMIRMAIRKYKLADSPVRFINANIFDSSLGENKTSHLLCTYGLKCIHTKDYQAFIDAIDSCLIEEGTLSLLEFQFPSHRLYRSLFKIYLHTFYRLGCLLFSGSGRPADALIESISLPMNISLLKELFEIKGFEINIEERWKGAVVFVYGRKLGA